MILQEILEAHKIYSIKKLVKETGLNPQRAWYLWHGKTRLSLDVAKLLVKKDCATWEELEQLQEKTADTSA
jgi:Cro/C1-type helix-turn-helix DNA-binding protein